MAATRLIALHQRKGKSIAHSLSERTDYAKNPEKTEKGELVSLITLNNGMERIRSVSNVFHLYRDLPRKYDAWDIDSQTERREVPMDGVCEAEIACSGGIFAELKVTRRFSSSVITQHIRLTAEEPQLEFITEADWQECHRLLKVSFDTGIDADDAEHQIQFGYISRPAHRSRRYDTDRFEVPAHAWTALHDATHGAALLNDCKYGVSANDGVVSLSLLRSPAYPDASADRGRHRFIYVFRVWDGPLETSGVTEAAEALNDPLITVPGSSVPLRLMDYSDPCVTVESVKLSEDWTGDLIVRMFESMGGTRTSVIHPFLPFSAVCICSIDELPGEILPVKDSTFTVSFKPFEIITLRLRPLI